MKKLLFLAFLALVFRAGVKLGKEKVREQYFGWDDWETEPE